MPPEEAYALLDSMRGRANPSEQVNDLLDKLEHAGYSVRTDGAARWTLVDVAGKLVERPQKGMLQNLTDDEIEDLLDLGWLYDEHSRYIRKEARYNLADRVVGSIYDFQAFPEPGTPYYSLSDLLLCEYLTFDDLRRDWKYHGLLLDNPVFCEKLVHNSQCPCRVCREARQK